jgi:hypothetical protein
MSLIFGFFLIPIHELGHVIGDWITGHPAAMSYARDYLLSGGETPFLGLLGGPLLPLMLSAVSVVLIYRGTKLSVFYPIAIVATFDRLLLYLWGILPTDEKSLADKMGWNTYSFEYFFLSAEVVLLLLVVASLFRHKVGLKQSILVFVIPLISFIVCALIGVFVVERYVFPSSFNVQFR